MALHSHVDRNISETNHLKNCIIPISGVDLIPQPGRTVSNADCEPGRDTSIHFNQSTSVMARYDTTRYDMIGHPIRTNQLNVE